MITQNKFGSTGAGITGVTQSDEYQNQNQESDDEDDDNENIEDDLMLTKTEGSVMLKFGSGVCST